jgi:hypothetical protein
VEWGVHDRIAACPLAAARASRPVDDKWLVTVSVGLGSLMASIGSPIVNVAMPYLRGTVLAYEKVFLLQGIVVLAVLPLLFFLKVDRPKQSGHVELPLE